MRAVSVEAALFYGGNMEPRKNICVLIMPTGGCNMNCDYCSHTPHYKASTEKVMSVDTLEQIFMKTIPFYEHVDFLWHGGEPLLAGLEFYKHAVELQKKYSLGNCTVTNKIQTNCTLAKGELAEFLVNSGFEFGTSYDGTINDMTRGRSKEILAGIHELRKLGKRCNCIFVVSSLNVNSMIDSYEFFKSNGISFKYNNYINTTKDDIGDKLSLSLDEYVEAQKKLFDYWLYDRDCNIRVTSFFVYIEYLLFNRKLVGKYNSCLGKWVGVRSNGDIVQCNRYNKSYYGNISEVNRITDAFVSEGFKSVLAKAIARREKCMKMCNIYDFCQGGCIVEASHELGIETIGNFSCQETQLVFEFIKQRIESVLENYDEIKGKINPTLQNCIDQYLEKSV